MKHTNIHTGNLNALAGKGMICVIKMGRWGATKQHREATDEVNAQNNTDAAKVSVTLTKHPALKQITSIDGAARQCHYGLSLPSVDEGLRIVPAVRLQEHSDNMRVFASQRQKVVDQFMADYDQEARTAPSRLGGLYDARKWPSAEKVRERFRFETDYREIPVQGQWQRWLLDSAEEGKEELRQRVADAVRHVAERLSIATASENAIVDGRTLRDSVIGNLREILELAPDLNLTSDVHIEELVREAQSLTRYSAEDLRNNSSLRKEMAARANKVSNMFKF